MLVSETISGVRGTWRILWGQKLGRLVVLVFSALALIHLFGLGPEGLRVGLTRNIDRIVLPVMIVVLFVRAKTVDRVEERRFWDFVMAALVIWFIGNALWFFSYDFDLPRWANLGVDVCYILLYLFLFLASDQQPQLKSGWSSGDVLYRFSLIGASVFIALMFGYFIVVPWAVQPSENLQYFSSFNLYVTLDTLLTVKFGLLFLATGVSRWRRAFALMAAVNAVLAAGDMLEGLGLAEIVETVVGGRIDTIWLVPHFLLFVMILTCAGRETGDEDLEDDSVTPVQSLLPFYAFALPLVHLGLYLSGHLDPAARTPREAIVFVGLIVFGILSLAQQNRLERAVVSLRADLTVRALDDKLRQSQRLESIGRLAGGIAHDFNNLLMVITSYTELARANVSKSDHRVQDRLNEIDRAADRAADLVRQLLAFGRRQVLRPEVVHVNELVVNLEAMLSRIIGDDVDLVVDLDCEVRRTRVDPTLLEQVIVNLVVNARDAMPRGGTVNISTRCRQESPEEGALGWVELCVSDTGEGINPAVSDRIFEPYFTTKEMEKGTGLGLATVHGIVEQSGGFIEVESEPGRGSTFRVRLPHVEDEVAPPDEPVLVPDMAVAGKTVLLTEDEADIREAIAEYLEGEGVTVLQARDGLDALEVVARHHGDIHLLVTDLVMPRLSGSDLATRLLAERKDLKVIFVSGYTPDRIGGDGVKRDNTVFLQKPFLLSELIDAMREVLDR